MRNSATGLPGDRKVSEVAEARLTGVQITNGDIRMLHGVDPDIRDGEFMAFVGSSAAASPRCGARLPAWRHSPAAS
jgi:hypothetical protein